MSGIASMGAPFGRAISQTSESGANTSNESLQREWHEQDETFQNERLPRQDLERGTQKRIDAQPKDRANRPVLTRINAKRNVTSDRAHRVNWREHTPTTKNPWHWAKWLMFGYTDRQETSEEREKKFNALARMLCLLRDYEERFGIPEGGGPQDQQIVLQGLTERLYASGAPIWILGSVMTKVAEGLTGTRNVTFYLLPRKAFIFSPHSRTTFMFPIERANNMYKLDLVEKVMVRIASFASNTGSVSNVEASFPPSDTFQKLTESVRIKQMERDEQAKQILDLASKGAGLFFYTRAKDKASKKDQDFFEDEETEAFWTVEDSSKDLFCRLATLEAMSSIATVDELCSVPLYPNWALMLFRALSSACATAISFKGHWGDIIVAGFLAVVVAYVGVILSSTRQERLLNEVIASLVVGLVSGLIAIHWPDDTCFGAMAVGGVLNILQGSRVVYAVIMLMSKHTVQGTADLIEAIMFSGLICYSLKFGQDIAEAILGKPGSDEWTCTNGIETWWYFLFVPISAIAWSGLTSPYYFDLFVMGLHGVLAYVVNLALRESEVNSYLRYFVSALTATTAAGLVSRFTGRQALGNSLAGLYVLLPGSYLVKSLFGGADSGFIETMTINAVVLGLGAWTGTLLCSPTVLGTNTGLLQRSAAKHDHRHGAMIYF